MNLALLGTLAILQIVFLPGYLLLRLLRIGGGLVSTAVLSFALSLLVNHVLVVSLVVAGAYRPGVVYVLFAAELAIWLGLDWRRLGTRLDDALFAAKQRTVSFFLELDGNSGIRSVWLRRGLIAAAVVLIAGFAAASLAETGRIFDQWDAVVSWNRWAIDWAGNRLPEVTSYYPQLLPTNVSLTYVFMQTSEIWIFAKAVQFLFCLLLLLAMLDAARRPGCFGLVPGILVSYLLFVALLRYRMLSSGYADVPLAFFAFMPVYAMILAGDVSGQGQRNRCLVLGALLAAGAALTKQTGLYVAAVYPFLVWLDYGRGSNDAFLRTIAAIVLLLALIVSPWYVYKFADIRAGHDRNNTPQLVQDFHEGRTMSARMVHAGEAVLDAVTLPGGALLLAALAASLYDTRSRRLLAFFAPLGLLWAAGFSYDLRNLAMLVPFVGMAAGAGIVRTAGRLEKHLRIWSKATSRLFNPEPTATAIAFSVAVGSGLNEPPKAIRPGWLLLANRFRVAHAGVLLVPLLLVSVLSIRNEALWSLQRTQQRRVGIVSLNRQLYDFAAEHPQTSLIATDYLAMKWLPHLAPRSIVCTCHELAAFRQTFDRPDVRFILVRREGQAAAVSKLLARPLEVRLLFEDHGFALYEKVAPSA